MLCLPAVVRQQNSCILKVMLDRYVLECRADVEDITQKTGNYKKFSVFVQMLTSALAQRSESVFVDLLTYTDLEMLKARRAGATPTGEFRVLAKRSSTAMIMLSYLQRVCARQTKPLEI
jgi:hypothetical protein